MHFTICIAIATNNKFACFLAFFMHGMAFSYAHNTFWPQEGTIVETFMKMELFIFIVYL